MHTPSTKPSSNALRSVMYVLAAGAGPRRHRLGSERGQTTAEYALVLVGAATIATLIIAWASSTSRISGLLDTVLRSVTGLVA